MYIYDLSFIFTITKYFLLTITYVIEIIVATDDSASEN